MAREHSPLTVAIAKQVKAERENADVSQQELATRAGMSITTYRRIERGERPPTMGQVEDIAAALGVALSTLIRRAEDRDDADQAEDGPRFPPAVEVADLELQLRSEAEAAAEGHAPVKCR